MPNGHYDKIPVTVYVDVDFNWTEAEPATHDYPGCDAEVEVTKVTLHGHDITKHMDAEQIKDIEDGIGSRDADERRESEADLCDTLGGPDVIRRWFPWLDRHTAEQEW